MKSASAEIHVFFSVDWVPNFRVTILLGNIPFQMGVYWILTEFFEKNQFFRQFLFLALLVPTTANKVRLTFATVSFPSNVLEHDHIRFTNVCCFVVTSFVVDTCTYITSI